MKIKKIKSIIKRIYARGFYDGVDVTRGCNDKFCGNKELRGKHEEEIQEKYYQELREALKP